VLQIIKESQQQHGLRHGDYQRYRGYCSRRLRRLRKTLGFKMGNRHKFTGKKVTPEMLSDSRYLLLVLMGAERAWSYSMQLKQEANTEPRKRFHLLSRLRKAAKHGEELERLCESNRVDAKTKLEAQAYHSYLTGMLHFELQEWKPAMEAFNKCKTIYEKLASAFTEELAVLYHQRVEEISPNIRYCAYNIGDQNAMNELIQMRLSAGGGGRMMAEKLEVSTAPVSQGLAEGEAMVLPAALQDSRFQFHSVQHVVLYCNGVCIRHTHTQAYECGGDQNAMNELIQMRRSAGGGGRMMAEKLEVSTAPVSQGLAEGEAMVLPAALQDSRFQFHSVQHALITQTRAKQAATMSEVEWRGRTIPVKIDKAASEETKERLYESLLSESRDAIQAVREELKADAKQRDRALDGETGKVSNLQYLHSYLTYIKLWTVVKRNESMARVLQAKLKEPQPDESKRGPRPQDLIRLYDIILQSLAELPQLLGMEDDNSFQKEVALKTLVYKAYRCFFIAQSYVLVKKWSEALVLYQRVLKYAKEVQVQAKSCNSSLKDLPDVQELITEVNAETYSLQAAAILDTEDSAETPSQSQEVKDNKPLCDRLEAFHLDPSLVGKQPNLVTFPPEFQPIPCKPLFFDLALNHVAFPPLDDKVEQKGKGGLTGYIKGIFGFGS
ncbi:UNVERIFIED_CONTAM: hypothetical protein FKN15_062701, partial [Acipenser sinensis]